MAGYLTRYWAVNQCKAFFGLSDADERLVVGSAGLQTMRQLWEHDGPEHFYEHPLQVLRQEHYHLRDDAQYYQHGGFWHACTTGVILDVGCGTAELARLPWILHGHSYVGVEASQACRAYTRQKYAQTGFVVCPDLRCAAVHYPVVDGLICTDFFEHVPAPLDFLRQMWRQLRIGGHALLRFDDSFPHPGHLRESIAQIPEWWAWVQSHAECVEVDTYVWCVKTREE